MPFVGKDDPAPGTIEAIMRQVAQGVALASGTEITVEYIRYGPTTIKHAHVAEVALAAAADAGLQASTDRGQDYEAALHRWATVMPNSARSSKSGTSMRC